MSDRATGSSFEDYLEAEGLLEEVDAIAVKRVVAWELGQAMIRGGISKSAMAERLHTSRSQLDRLLDPANTQVKLGTMVRAAREAGLRLRVVMEPIGEG